MPMLDDQHLWGPHARPGQTQYAQGLYRRLTDSISTIWRTAHASALGIFATPYADAAHASQHSC